MGDQSMTAADAKALDTPEQAFRLSRVGRQLTLLLSRCAAAASSLSLRPPRTSASRQRHVPGSNRALVFAAVGVLVLSFVVSLKAPPVLAAPAGTEETDESDLVRPLHADEKRFLYLYREISGKYDDLQKKMVA